MILIVRQTVDQLWNHWIHLEFFFRIFLIWFQSWSTVLTSNCCESYYYDLISCTYQSFCIPITCIILILNMSYLNLVYFSTYTYYYIKSSKSYIISIFLYALLHFLFIFFLCSFFSVNYSHIVNRRLKQWKRMKTILCYLN